MSNSINENESAVKTPGQLLGIIVGALVGIPVIVWLLTQYVVVDMKTGAGSQAQSSAAIAARIRPPADEGYALNAPPASAAPVTAKAEAAPVTAKTEAAPVAAVAAKAESAVGKRVYEGACQACHATGVAGAPKFADKAAWLDRIKQGAGVLHDHAIKGFQGKAGMMPPRGGSQASDDEIKSAVDYMVDAAR